MREEGRGFCPGLSTHRACKTAMRIGTLSGRIHFTDRVGPPGWPGWELPPNPESAAENGLLAEKNPKLYQQGSRMQQQKRPV